MAREIAADRGQVVSGDGTSTGKLPGTLDSYRQTSDHAREAVDQVGGLAGDIKGDFRGTVANARQITDQLRTRLPEMLDRATTLITPEGNHVRIPNAVIYKETLVNASITPSTLGAIEVVVPFESSTASALEAINTVLQPTDGVLGEPTPRALVQALEGDSVRIKATYWMPSKGLDVDKLQSDLRLKIKVALQQSTMSQSPPVANPGAIEAPAEPAPSTPEASTTTTTAAEANLRKDTEAAAHTEAAGRTDHEATPIDHAIRQAEAAAAIEGGNLLVNAKG